MIFAKRCAVYVQRFFTIIIETGEIIMKKTTVNAPCKV